MNARSPGFDPERILALQVPFSGPQYRAVAPQRRFAEEMLERVEQLPGVEAASVIAQGELRGSGTAPHDPKNDASKFRSGDAPSPCNVQYSIIRLPPRDGPAGGPRSLAGRKRTRSGHRHKREHGRRALGEGEAVGKQLGRRRGRSRDAGPIIGVVSDLKYSRLDAPAEPEAAFPINSAILAGHDDLRVEPSYRCAQRWRWQSQRDRERRSNSASGGSKDSRASSGRIPSPRAVSISTARRLCHLCASAGADRYLWRDRVRRSAAAQEIGARLALGVQRSQVAAAGSARAYEAGGRRDHGRAAVVFALTWLMAEPAVTTWNQRPIDRYAASLPALRTRIGGRRKRRCRPLAGIQPAPWRMSEATSPTVLRHSVMRRTGVRHMSSGDEADKPAVVRHGPKNACR